MLYSDTQCNECVFLWQVQFYYPCIIADYTTNSLYIVKVHSLPLASGSYDNSAEHRIFIPRVISKYFVYNVNFVTFQYISTVTVVKLF